MFNKENKPSKQHSEEEVWGLFVQLLSERTQDKFLKLRNIIINSEKYKPYNHLPQQMESLFEKEEFVEATQIFFSNWPTLTLSPRVHFVLSQISELNNNKEKVEFYRVAALVVLDLIIKSGDGTKKRPYSVLHVSDEYDVLWALKKERSEQKLIMDNGYVYDCFTTSDGEEIYFDIKDMFCSQDSANRGQNNG